MFLFYLTLTPSGNTIDATALNALLDETEGWMWDKPDAPLADLTDKVRRLFIRIQQHAMKETYLNTVRLNNGAERFR